MKVGSELHPKRIKKTLPPKPPGKTLNRARRYEVLVKINEENRHIMSRLQNAKSVYNVNKWEKERKEHNRMVKRLSSTSGRVSSHPHFAPNDKFKDPCKRRRRPKSQSKAKLDYDPRVTIAKRPKRKKRIIRLKPKYTVNDSLKNSSFHKRDDMANTHEGSLDNRSYDRSPINLNTKFSGETI
ncbi:unnamed protein product [Moneuplotes crassus]|uniref:Uncharacterized protein n=1 Tax=Euplotes crassus TaxID=5936 RepID=A0AAD1UEM1_EUPCR|nr:unnamed protein product [Moneuplotes crassus]